MPCQLEPIGYAISLQHGVNNLTPEYCNFYWNASQYTSLHSVNIRFCQSLGAFPLKYNPHAPHSLEHSKFVTNILTAQPLGDSQSVVDS